MITYCMRSDSHYYASGKWWRCSNYIKVNLHAVHLNMYGEKESEFRTRSYMGEKAEKKVARAGF